MKISSEIKRLKQSKFDLIQFELIQFRLIQTKLIQVRLIQSRLIQVRLIQSKLIQVRLIQSKMIQVGLIQLEINTIDVRDESSSPLIYNVNNQKYKYKHILNLIIDIKNE